MKEKRNITIIDKKQIPSEEPAKTVLFHGYCKKYVAELAEQKGAPLTILCDDLRVPDECQGFREISRYPGTDRLCGSTG